MKKLLIAGLAVACTMVLFSVPARAQDEDPTINATAYGLDGTAGSWNVVATSANGTTWTVNITANTVSGLTSDAYYIHIGLQNANGDINASSRIGGITGDGSWSASDSSTFNTNNIYRYLLHSGANSFTATITLNGSGYGNNLDNGAVNSLYVYMSGDCSWAGTGYVTPEGSSLAMLLPGLLPLALVVRRRRRS